MNAPVPSPYPVAIPVEQPGNKPAPDPYGATRYEPAAPGTLSGPHDATRYERAGGPETSAVPGQGVGALVRIKQFRKDIQISQDDHRGGMGQVWLAENLGTGQRWVALKELHPAHADDPVFRARFDREAEALAQLDHPYIVRIYGRNPPGEAPWIAMEYVAGPSTYPWEKWPQGSDHPPPPLTLARRVQRDGPLPLDELIRLGKKLCRALHYAHQCEVLHRDVKPLNILFDQEMGPRLVDFGLARPLRAAAGHLTSVLDVMGSMFYTAPEMKRDPHKVDARADVYSLGATLLFAATGKTGEYWPFAKFDERCRLILNKATAPDQEDRYSSAEELARALEGLEAAPVFATLVCPLCQQDSPADSEFCTHCRRPLTEPCLDCGHVNPAGATGCARCGGDLSRRVREEKTRWTRVCENIEKGVAVQHLPDALTRLRLLAGHRHPRLRAWAEWANKTLPALERKHETACRGRDQRLAQARVALAEKRPRDAFKTLNDLPDSYHTDETRELLRQARAAVEEWTRLETAIRRAKEIGVLSQVRDQVRRCLELQPNSPEILGYQDEIQREDERLWKQTDRENSIEAYERYLRFHPQGAYAAEANAELADRYRERLVDDLFDTRVRSRYLTFKPYGEGCVKGDRDTVVYKALAVWCLFGGGFGLVFSLIGLLRGEGVIGIIGAVLVTLAFDAVLMVSRSSSALFRRTREPHHSRLRHWVGGWLFLLGSCLWTFFLLYLMLGFGAFILWGGSAHRDGKLFLMVPVSIATGMLTGILLMGARLCVTGFIRRFAELGPLPYYAYLTTPEFVRRRFFSGDKRA